MTQTDFIADDRRLLERWRQHKLTDWLAEGLLRAERGESRAFYPHSAVMLTGEPIDGLVALYRGATPGFQRKMAVAVDACCAMLVPSSNAYAGIAAEQRRDLFRQLAVLTKRSLSFRAAERLLASLLDGSEYWRASGFLDEIAATTIDTVCCLAIEGVGSHDWNSAVKERLESSILRLVASHVFKSAFAPLCIRALVSIDARKFLQSHRKTFALHIHSLHKLDPREQSLAYETIQVIVEKAPKELAEIFPSLDLADEGDGRWMFDGLTNERGKFRIIRLSGESAVVDLLETRSPGAIDHRSHRLPRLMNKGLIDMRIKSPPIQAPLRKAGQTLKAASENLLAGFSVAKDVLIGSFVERR